MAEFIRHFYLVNEWFRDHETAFQQTTPAPHGGSLGCDGEGFIQQSDSPTSIQNLGRESMQVCLERNSVFFVELHMMENASANQIKAEGDPLRCLWPGSVCRFESYENMVKLRKV